MYLGIEIGGTKLQLGIGPGDRSQIVAIERLDIDVGQGAAGIRRQIEQAAPALIRQHGVEAIGIGFGGPVDAAAGTTLTSHQVDGWDRFPLVDWCRKTLGLPTAILNDADAAGLAEARFGAGQGRKVVFYVTVGSGIGGALVVDGQVFRGGQGVAAEIGHLRPGLDAVGPKQTVEAVASGFGIAATAQAWLRDPNWPAWIDGRPLADQCGADLLARCGGQIDQLSGKMVAQAAAGGNRLAREVFRRAIQTLGWAIAQVITLVAPNVIVVGGGVPLAGEAIFFRPLAEEIVRYSFPPLRGTYEIVPAALGEEVVVHGALAVARG